MAKDTHFSLAFDKADPTDKDCKKGDGNGADVADFVDFLNKQNEGKLTYLGGIYSGNVKSANEPNTALESTAVTSSCVIVYLGGTAYKICS